MTNLTNTEAAILEIFITNGMEVNGATDAAGIKDDNMTWTRATDCRQILRLKSAEVMEAFESLQAKGLISDSGERMVEGVSKTAKPNASDWTATDAGIDLYFGEPQADEDEADILRKLFTAHGVYTPRNLCRGLRSVARAWRTTGGQRQTFLVACETLGLNLSNASAEWQGSSKRAD